MPTELCRRLGIEIPLIQAPLGGGPGTPELAAAVSNAGALGTLAGAYLKADELRAQISKTRELSAKPFAINLFIPSAVPLISETRFQTALDLTRKYREELGLPDPALKISPFEDFEKLFEIVLAARPALFSFVFGLLDSRSVDECRRAGILTMGTATTIEEALQLEASGVDSIVLQGTEAGGHRGLFQVEGTEPGLRTLDLAREAKEKLKIPFAAAGGIMDGASIAAVLRAGAQAAQLGTAFLLCPETKIPEAYRRALRLENSKTRLTRVFSGRWARGIENRFMREMEGKESSLLPWPAQNAFTRDIRTQSAQRGLSDFLSLWAGEEFSKIRDLPAARLVRILDDEIRLSLKSS